MSEKTIGILGGMGPEATLRLYSEIIHHTPVKNEQDHLRVIIFSNPKIPSRRRAISGTGRSPVVTMVDTAQALVRAGVDFIVIPCVTAHYYIDEIRKNTPLPIISIIDVIKNHIRSRFPDIHAAGILATAALIGTSLLQKNLSEISVQCIIPDTNNQAIVEQCITTAKVPVQGLEGLDSERRELTQKLTAVSRRLAVLGADIIISACTEIGLVLRDGDIDIPVVDSVQLLAEEAVRYALGK